MTQDPTFRFIDLFAGIGGFHHALSALGGECVLASDSDAKCRKVYAATWPEMSEEQIVGDIRGLTQNEDGSDKSVSQIRKLVPAHDVLCAGFPCQPFSKSGLQLGVLDQTRGTLFYDIMEIAKARKPRFIILENVRNLAGPRHRHTFETIIGSLRECGYRVADQPLIFSPHLLPPEMGGRPQRRERVFILAEYVGLKKSRIALKPVIQHKPADGWDPHKWDVTQWLQDDSEVTGLSKYKLADEDVACINAWNAFVSGIAADALPGFPIWSDDFNVKPIYPPDAPDWKRDLIRKNSEFYVKHRAFIDEWRSRSWLEGQVYRVADFIPSRRKFEWQARQVQPLQADRDLWKLAIQFRPSGVRVRPLTYLPTLVAITQNSVIGPRRRFITPVEAGRMQGFPDSVFPHSKIDDASAYKQAGNAVNIGVIQYVARSLLVACGADWVHRIDPVESYVPDTASI